MDEYSFVAVPKATTVIIIWQGYTYVCIVSYLCMPAGSLCINTYISGTLKPCYFFPFNKIFQCLCKHLYVT